MCCILGFWKLFILSKRYCCIRILKFRFYQPVNSLILWRWDLIMLHLIYFVLISTSLTFQSLLRSKWFVQNRNIFTVLLTISVSRMCKDPQRYRHLQTLWAWNFDHSYILIKDDHWWRCLLYDNKAKRRISKRVFQENKALRIFRKMNISYPLIRTRTFEIRPFALLPTNVFFLNLKIIILKGYYVHLQITFC